VGDRGLKATRPGDTLCSAQDLLSPAQGTTLWRGPFWLCTQSKKMVACTLLKEVSVSNRCDETASPHPLESLEGKRIGGYRLRLGDLRPLRMSGWRGFTLLLEDDREPAARAPVVKGIFSAGGKDGVRPWMDIQYWELAQRTSPRGTPRIPLRLTSGGLDRKLFRVLSELIPAGGHLMVSYEDEQAIHTETMRSLHIGVPPVATRLGALLFHAGFHYVKNWYLAEGGFEGPRKLWAEKAANERAQRELLEKTAAQLRAYCARPPGTGSSGPDDVLEQGAQKRARELLDIIGHTSVREDAVR